MHPIKNNNVVPFQTTGLTGHMVQGHTQKNVSEMSESEIILRKLKDHSREAIYRALGIPNLTPDIIQQMRG